MYTSLTNRRSFIKKMAVLSAITVAATIFPGIEIVRIIRKEQLISNRKSMFKSFHSLAA